LGFAVPAFELVEARLSCATPVSKLLNDFSKFFRFSPAYKCAVASARRAPKNRARLGVDGCIRATVNTDQRIASALRRP
jgi:hypothetical protein